MAEALMFAGSGVALLVIAALIVGVQRRAAQCPEHSPLAGRIAWLLAAGCTLAAASLVVLAWRSATGLPGL